VDEDSATVTFNGSGTPSVNDVATSQ